MEYSSRRLASVAGVIGSPARAAMLDLLMDGEPHSATELSRTAGVAASTGSNHLAQLVDARLVTSNPRGRHRLYALAGPDVARALEALAAIAPASYVRGTATSSKDRQLRFARTCYDHLAGSLGVALTDALIKRRLLAPRDGHFEVTRRGRAMLLGFGVDLDAARRRRRSFSIACLDWSERRHHLGGAVGASICDRLLDLGWMRRRASGRSLVVTARGRKGLAGEFGVNLRPET